ncbi:3'-5' exonuclease [Acidiluteibacter ferrifornacis]|uniref:3'-5' exonuclease n=1 Tax=Acidiluteibacter ferrifornacis TaxID=2692424 RepID=A0A6N9NKW0_9FLAO|nr:3'-5' exonuclease [Acidiluteibacter ferrifornacis]NBG65797.1 3'-5' exonuclease [Acidiluteibacter ferrifornacis]
MNLELNKPIVFFDLETTGVNVATDRIVEISILKLHKDGKKEIKTRRINPTIPISPESTSIHGISDEDVKDEPTFKSLAKGIAQFIGNADLAGYNSNKFDVPMLMEEFLRAEVDFDLSSRKLVDVQNIFHRMEQRTLVAAYKFYCNKDLIGAHGAEADNLATYEVLEAQIEKYPELENDVNFLSEFSKRGNNADLMGRIVFDENNVEVFNFGKHKGKPVEEVLKNESSYYDWMMKGDFPLYTKKVLTAIKMRSFGK